jgi:hypothetical protein
MGRSQGKDEGGRRKDERVFSVQFSATYGCAVLKTEN